MRVDFLRFHFWHGADHLTHSTYFVAPLGVLLIVRVLEPDIRFLRDPSRAVHRPYFGPNGSLRPRPLLALLGIAAIIGSRRDALLLHGRHPGHRRLARGNRDAERIATRLRSCPCRDDCRDPSARQPADGSAHHRGRTEPVFTHSAALDRISTASVRRSCCSRHRSIGYPRAEKRSPTVCCTSTPPRARAARRSARWARSASSRRSECCSHSTPPAVERRHAPRRTPSPLAMPLAVVIVLGILLGAGGATFLDALTGFVQVRTWNWVVLLIKRSAAFTLTGFGCDRLLDRCAPSVGDRHLRQAATITPRGRRRRRPDPRRRPTAGAQQEKNHRAVELRSSLRRRDAQVQPPDGMIFQFPVVAFPETWPIICVPDCDQFGATSPTRAGSVGATER